MPDDIDRASDNIEAARQAAIAAARMGPFHHLRPTGFCVWCGDPVAPGRLHCRPVENECEADHLQYLRFWRGE